MSLTTYLTREQAALPDDLVERMARTAYEAGRPKGSGRPEWERCTPEWCEAARREMRAALAMAIVAGRLAVLA